MKSVDSCLGLYFGTPLAATKFEDARLSTQGTVNRHDAHIEDLYRPRSYLLDSEVLVM